MLMACIAFALVCYQRLPIAILDSDAGNQLGAGAGLALLRGIRDCTLWPGRSRCTPPTRQFRWGVWLALACGAIPLVFFLAFAGQTSRPTNGAHYYRYATYTATSLPSSYGAYFLTDSAFGAAVFALAVAGVIGSYLLLRPNNPSEGKVRDADVAEGTLLLALVALPIITFCLVKIVHGGMRDAYALSAVIGIAIALGCALSLARPPVVALFALFVFSSVGVRELNFWRANHSLRLASPATAVEKFVQSSGYGDLPVVVSSAWPTPRSRTMLRQRFSNRFFYLMDEEKELHYQGTDTFDRQVVASSRLHAATGERLCRIHVRASGISHLWGGTRGWL